jgi:hypothetical protein
MIAEELLLKVPAVVVNVPVAEPLMLKFPDTGNNPLLLLLRFTVAVPVGTPVSVTVQVVVWPVPSAPGAQLTEDSVAGATRFKLKVCDIPFAVAVNVAVWFEPTDATEAVKPAMVPPAPTVTLAGTVAFALLLDNVTRSPPPGAAAVSVTVQAELPGAFTLAGVQLTLLTVTAAFRLTVAVLVCPL